MKKNYPCFFTFFIACLIIAGCNQTQQSSSAPDEENHPEAQDAEEEHEKLEEPVEESQAKDDLHEHQGEQVEEGELVEKETSDAGNYNVFIGGEMVETDEQIMIFGESNLLPGARVVGEVIVGDEEEQVFFADTSEIVGDDGSFYMEIENHPLDDETRVSIRFHFDGQQDDAIIRHYGDRGQKLEGPFIYKHQGEVGGGSPQNIFKQAKATVIYLPKEEKAVRQFTEPNWHPMPNDMGDPRVWIEVDEVNHDHEYFYIQARSNLSEGALVNIYHGNARKDDTRVLPDGSFYAKFDYEYKEDTNITIQFDPSHWNQWNEVEEKYGAKGQRLVGNLVVSDKYSDKQLIEKVVEQQSNAIEVPDHVELQIDGSEMTLLVPDDVLFDFDEYELKNSSKEILDEISETLIHSFNKNDFEIVINGHTDNIGSESYNLDLSVKRAAEVEKHLEDKIDSANVTFTTKGFGSAKPVVSNETEKGQAKNRRVEIVINFKD
ncbi:OmpA family protein [Halalkalibacterium halodurans]|uniref:OmpA family protein n=1 Tax=Halalkalibacterium halodurans TaxID=86665 RepID=UPI002AA9C257|nr:OmpA family protein [Halalkalibacterium halodurans]MDY7221509.1 OmpA family protein [Halalkalibacterium halodurans]MDY7240785.1 OmpA family protein [Halalkalibacterium halodurans]